MKMRYLLEVLELSKVKIELLLLPHLILDWIGFLLFQLSSLIQVEYLTSNDPEFDCYKLRNLSAII